MGARGQTTLTEPPGAVERVELIGELNRSLDDRGRLSMPTSFRAAFATGAVVMRWPGPCVAIMPVDEYRQIEENMRSKQRDELADARAREALNALANHLHLDASGRLFIAEDLRAFAGFERELKVVGQRTRLELWAQATHEEGAEERWQALVAHISAEAL
jgi:MraZ protein